MGRWLLDKRVDGRLVGGLTDLIKPHIPLIFLNNSLSLTLSHKCFCFIFDKQMIFEYYIGMGLSD